MAVVLQGVISYMTFVFTYSCPYFLCFLTKVCNIYDTKGVCAYIINRTFLLLSNLPTFTMVIK